MPIQELQLGFESLAELDDGRVDRVLKKHLARIAQDCMDRPGDTAKRKVVVTFSAEPVVDPDEPTNCEYAKIEVECTSKTPNHRTRPLQMRVSTAGFRFNADFPDDINQQSLFSGPENGEE